MRFKEGLLLFIINLFIVIVGDQNELRWIFSQLSVHFSNDCVVDLFEQDGCEVHVKGEDKYDRSRDEELVESDDFWGANCIGRVNIDREANLVN